MTTDKRVTPTTSRVSACSACRLHKVRCDFITKRPQPCSRCNARGIHCEVTTGPVQARQTRRELQNELESLRRFVRVPTNTKATAAPPEATGASPPPSNRGSLSETGTHRSPGTISQSALDRQMLPTFPGERSTSEAGNDTPASNGVVLVDSHLTASQNLNDLEVSAEAIDACFDIFFHHYAPHVPILEERARPNICYARSHLLFWAIVAVGSRSYDDDPTLLTSLTNRLSPLLNTNVLARENPLATIQALSLFCSWPMPFVSLSDDTTPLKAGLLLSHAFLTGLNIQGTGQDFHDAKLKLDNSFATRRARLWYLCIIVCQRVHCCHGLVPPTGLDTHDEMETLRTADLEPALMRIVFEKRLSAIQSSGIVQLERLVASIEPQEREAALDSALGVLLDRLQVLDHDAGGDLGEYSINPFVFQMNSLAAGKFYLGTAKLQLLIFQLLIPRDILKDTKLQELHDLACTIIETLRHIEEDQLPPRSISRYAPIFVAHHSILAAFTVLKTSRSYLSATVDAPRGRKAYFFVVQLLRNMSVQAGDCFNRTMGILTQLWSSKNIFKRHDGTIDSLTLRCSGRLPMSVVYDCYWWWRWEFAGQAYPYDEDALFDGNMSRRSDPRTRPGDRIEDDRSIMPGIPPPNTGDAIFLSNQGGTEFFGLDSPYFEDFWLGGPDLRIMDWAPPFNNAPPVLSDSATMTNHLPNAWYSEAPQS